MNKEGVPSTIHDGLKKDSENTKNYLILIIDVNIFLWCEGIQIMFEKNVSKFLKLSDFLKSLFQFLRCYCLISSSEKICVIATCSNNSRIVYENYVSHIRSSLHNKDHFSDIYDQLLNFIIENKTRTITEKESALSSAFILALCYSNRVSSLYEEVSTRIFLVDVSKSPYYTNQYTQLMNIAYNAKRNNILIDTLSLNNKTNILEQICNITNGLYIDNSILQNLNNTDLIEDVITQIMIFWFLPSNNTRKYFSNTYLNEDTNLAVCSCHNKQIDIAFICSCCLTIYCSEKDSATNRDRMSCSTCKTRFTKSLLRNKVVCNLDFTAI